MNLAPRISISCLALFFVLPSCSSERPPSGSAAARPSERGTSVASVPGLGKQLGASFQRHVPSATRPTPGMADKQEREPFFAHAWNAEFRTEHDGSLSAVTQDESPANIAGAHFRDTADNQRLSSRFPATAAGDLVVTVGDKPGAWIHERIASASEESRAQLSEGRVVYAGAKPGLDRIYEVSGQRVEEYLRLADESALQQVAYEVEVGPAIADLVVDGSGHGLMAVDSDGKQVLKAPQPTGVDSQGHGVQGTLVAEKTSERHYVVRVKLDSAGVSFPVLLDPSWVSAGTMATARGDHTATLLQNGKVLVAGGYDVNTSAEIYDPATNAWTAAASLPQGRRGHTAALLSNGKVLIAGGENSSALSSSLLYDATSNSWSSAAPMAFARAFHSTITLSNGKVLEVGGNNSGSGVLVTELYNASNNSWSSAGSLSVARQWPGLTKLANGTVLVAGEVGGAGASTSELYNPSTNAWSELTSLASEHFGPFSLLPSGDVFYASGKSLSAEVYHASTHLWATVSPPSVARMVPTSTTLTGGKVLVAGGCDSNFTARLSSTELYDPNTDSWIDAGPMAAQRYGHTATLLPTGNVLVAGGNVSGQPNAELFKSPTRANGTACADGAECLSGYCADSVCCDASCVGHGVCSVAAGASADGVCTQFPNGTLCASSSPGNCLSGYCTDGVCCDADCSGGCGVCSATLGASADGVCTPLPIGTTSSCAPLVCAGSTSCPTSCTSDSQCVADHYCNKDGVCTPQKEQSLVCSPAPGTDCYEANCRVCATGHCTGGFCCDQACKDGCDVCSAIQGATANGVCTTLGAGKPGSPSCAPFVCNGTSPSCPTTCQDAGDCTSTSFCLNGACHGAAPAGALCASGAECASTFCADGVCCDSGCTGQCEACAEPGSEGTCIPVSNVPRGTRPHCEDSDPTCKGRCNGAVTTACVYPAQGTICAPAACDGDALVRSAVCDGAGVCQMAASDDCGTYTCDAASKSCRTSCVTTADCAGGNVCDSDGKCAVSGATCQDATTAKSPDGTLTSCDPYRCLNGQCKSTCSTAADCAPGATCDGGQCTNGTGGTSGSAGTAGTSGTSGTSGTAGSSNPAAAPASGDSGGCSVPSGSRGSSGGVLVIAAIAAAVSRRRRAS